MEKEVDRYYNEYKQGIVNLLTYSGIWPDHRDQSMFLRRFLNALTLLAEFSVTFGIVHFCIDNITNINTLTRGMGLMISFSSAFFKTIVMIGFEKEVVKMNRGLSDRFEEDLKEPKNQLHLLALFPSFARFFVFHFYCTGTVIVLMVISSVWALRQGKYIRIFPRYVPFEYEAGSAMHWAIFGWELIEGFYCWSNTVAVDSTFGLYSLHLVGELRLLSTRFRKLRGGDDYGRNLKDCVDRHCELAQMCHSMQRVFGFLSVWLAITCAIVMCAIIFQSSESDSLTIYKVIYLMVYCCIKLIQTYTYAYYGNIIIVESENSLNSIYESDWAGSGDLRLMNDALIIRSQNPMLFDAMGIVIVRLDLFSKIIHTSVSYFFLLKTLDERTWESAT